MFVHPELPAGHRIKRVHRVLGTGEVHDTVDHERRAEGDVAHRGRERDRAEQRVPVAEEGFERVDQRIAAAEAFRVIDDARVRADLQAGRVVIITGFQGIDDGGNITTLGRGGSDTSAVAVAAALKADECLIYTDVDGVYTTDPRVVPEARRLRTVSFEEMLEMASLGSKVLQIRSVEFAGKYKVPLRVLSSFTPWDIDLNEEASSGTLITFEEDEHMEKAIVSGIAFNRDEAKISIIGVPDKPGIAYQILGAVAEANIEVDMIIQNLSKDGKTDFSFTVHRNDHARALDLLKSKVLPALGAAGVEGDAKICKVSIVGIGMRSHVGVASKMFRSLSEEGINIQMISTSEIKTSVVIDEKYMELAVRALHRAFDLDQAAAVIHKFNPRRPLEAIRKYTCVYNLKQLPSGKWTWKYDAYFASAQRMGDRQALHDQLAAAAAVLQRMKFDGHLVARLDRVGAPTARGGRLDGLHLERPLDLLAGIVGGHDVQPDMRVGPLQFLHGAGLGDHLVAVEHGEGVMREHRRRECGQRDGGKTGSEVHDFLPA
mgnify:CR=1 FL=1